MSTFLAVGCNKSRVEPRCVIEMIGESLDTQIIQSIASKSGANDTRLYQWEDHMIIYSNFDNVDRFTQQLSAQFPDIKLKRYITPFYQFKITEHREGYTPAKEWDHVVLTANLVDDMKMQEEYMEYHRTQFEEWPEVAKGFCNADYQELNAYRNGRQLMLIISIPANESFEELDPKTWENNPRVNEWNSIMGAYQVGIEGTKPGESWVFLNEIK
ncbi:MAG: L-rhamnose mutarotase [Rikenellaceae bacterium]